MWMASLRIALFSHGVKFHQYCGIAINQKFNPI